METSIVVRIPVEIDGVARKDGKDGASDGGSDREEEDGVGGVAVGLVGGETEVEEDQGALDEAETGVVEHADDEDELVELLEGVWRWDRLREGRTRVWGSHQCPGMS